MPNDPDHLVGNVSKAARWLLPFFSAPILVALDAYLGLQRLQGQLGHFGMTVALLNPSIPDYIERGVGITARSVFVVALIGLGLFTAHSLVRRATPATRRHIGAACVVTGLPVLALGLVGWLNWFIYSDMYPVVPMLTALGSNLFIYGLYLRKRTQTPATATSRAIAATLILINSYLAIWIMGIYAQLTGVALARDIDRNPPLTLCADRPLGIPGGLAAHEQGPCRHRYPGLRQVACGDTRCLFAHRDPDGNHTVFLVHLGEDIVITSRPDPQAAAPRR
jgi:hypothetical protein